MKQIINKIKIFLNRYNPREITRLLKCIEKEIYNINKVIGIIRNREVKERNEVLTNRIDNHYDELSDKYNDLENTIDDVEYELSNKIKELKHVNKNPIDKKIDEVANELILSELSTYLCDSIDILDNYDKYNYHNIKRDLLIALIDCKDYNINVTRRINR